MAIRVGMPNLGHTMEAGTLSQWLVAEGAPVSVGQAIALVETDKATVEIEAPASATVLRLTVAVGQLVPVGGTIAWLGKAGERIPLELHSESVPPAAGTPTREPIPGNTLAAAYRAERRAQVSPLARRLATSYGVDLATVKGSGPGGAVTKTDVLAAAVLLGAPTGFTPVDTPAMSAEPDLRADMRMRGLRKSVAERMSASWQNPQVGLFAEVDFSAARRLCQELAVRDPRASLTDIVVKATALALREHPCLNRIWRDGALKDNVGIHVGLAVALKDGVLVPVIHNTDQQGLRVLAAARRALVTRTLAGKLLPDEMAGGTFSVSNLGLAGVDWFTPLVNPPQVAVLGVGRVAARPCAVGEEVVVRDIAYLSVGFDHRALDGEPAGRFLAMVKRLIEAPDVLLTTGDS